MQRGDKLGNFEILRPLGSGAMGQVYLAEDKRLRRRVAVKVLPPEFAAEPERLARFEREARAAAALNHPHIAAVHDIGLEGDTHFMVQEYLEGETLRSLLRGGRLPLEYALQLATEIAEGIAAAHAAGVVHRDLKPENVMVTEDDHAKVLDFGLAKLTAAEASGASGDSDESPTALGTARGQVMGTPAYMAPEQAEDSGEIDERADLFACGCVLYEMVSGQQAFAAENLVKTIVKIVHEPPAPVVGIPPRLWWIIEKCLEKRPEARYQNARDLVVDLRRLALAVKSGTAESRPAAARSGSSRPAWAVAATAVIALATVVWTTRLAPSVPAPVHRFSIPAPALGNVLGLGFQMIQLSDDGGQLVYFGEPAPGAAAQAYLRPLDTLETTPVPGSSLLLVPEISPDGRWMVGLRGYSLWRFPLAGGRPFQLAATSAGADWIDADTVLHSSYEALFRVPIGGGDPELIVEIQGDPDRVYLLPRLLPGGRHVLMTAGRRNNWADADAVVVSLETGAVETIIASPGSSPRYVSSGHVVYARDDTLEAVAFDPERARMLGTPSPILPDAYVSPGAAEVHLAVSDTGTLAYVPAGGAVGRTLTWVDRNGGETEALRITEVLVHRPRLSPDGRQVIVETAGLPRRLRVYDLDRGSVVPLPQSASGEVDPIWGPDGSEIAFTGAEIVGGELLQHLRVRRPDGTGMVEVLPESDRNQVAYSWATNGDLGVYEFSQSGGDRNIAVLSRDNGWSRTEIAATSANERSPAFSPDGRWMAYASDESGQDQVYVVSYPEFGERHTISAAGGRAPAWSRDGSELYYIGATHMMAVAIQTEPAFRAGRPVSLFDMHDYVTELPSSGSRGYDVAADGRFLMVRPPPDAGTEPVTITLVTSWASELERLVPHRY